jgi:hypothetical protein
MPATPSVHPSLLLAARRRWRALLCLAVVSAALLTAGAAVADTGGSSHAVSCAGWTPVAVPAPPSSVASFAAVSGTSAGDVWAVGYSQPTSRLSEAALTEHFNGSAWSVVPAPSQGNVSWLTGVVAVAADDAWAVGAGTASGGEGFDPIALHWDGSAWNASPVTAPPTGGLFAAVAAAGPDDVWAVGNSGLNNTSSTLVEHFDGHEWSIVRSPHRGIPSRLEGVAIAGPDDVWAVGQSAAAIGAPRMLREHWDGRRWSVPDGAAKRGNLAAVSAAATGDVWAAGQGAVLTSTVAARFDGSSWRSTHSRNPSPVENELLGVSTVSPTETWATGGFYDAGLRLLIERWDGARWRIAYRGDHGTLSAVTTLPGGESWAVGELAAGPAPFAAVHC